MNFPIDKRGLRVLLLGMSVPCALAQQIHISIPRRSQMVPVQRLNREGVSYVLKHKYEKAESVFFKAYLYDPADPFTLNNLGYVSELQGEVDRAANYYKLAEEQGSEAIVDVSSEKSLRGKPLVDALATISNLPMKVNRINMYAVRLLSQNRGFEAKALLTQTLRLDPRDPFTLNNLGAAEQSIGDYPSALKHYDAAAASDSKLPIVISLQRSARGRAISVVAAAAAEKLRIRMSRMTSAQIEAQMLTIRGVAALNENDWQTARDDFEAAYKTYPQSGFTLNNVGYIAEHDGELETASTFYARARKAEDAESRVGLTSQADAQGQHLAKLASQSYKDAAAELRARILKRDSTDSSKEPVELIRRDGSAEPLTPPATR